jgi:hypothetical protein
MLIFPYLINKISRAESLSFSINESSDKKGTTPALKERFSKSILNLSIKQLN